MDVIGTTLRGDPGSIQDLSTWMIEASGAVKVMEEHVAWAMRTVEETWVDLAGETFLEKLQEKRKEAQKLQDKIDKAQKLMNDCADGLGQAQSLMADAREGCGRVQADFLVGHGGLQMTEDYIYGPDASMLEQSMPPEDQSDTEAVQAWAKNASRQRSAFEAQLEPFRHAWDNAERAAGIIVGLLERIGKAGEWKNPSVQFGRDVTVGEAGVLIAHRAGASSKRAGKAGKARDKSGQIIDDYEKARKAAERDVTRGYPDPTGVTDHQIRAGNLERVQKKLARKAGRRTGLLKLVKGSTPVFVLADTVYNIAQDQDTARAMFKTAGGLGGGALAGAGTGVLLGWLGPPGWVTGAVVVVAGAIGGWKGSDLADDLYKAAVEPAGKKFERWKREHDKVKDRPERPESLPWSPGVA